MINNKLLGLLGICAKAGKIVSGADACLEEIKTNSVKLLIIAEDASDKTKKIIFFTVINIIFQLL